MSFLAGNLLDSRIGCDTSIVVRTKIPRAHRVVEIRWLPRSEAEWAVFTAARLEAGRLWSRMVQMHAVIRRFGWRWPSRSRWERWARGKFPALSAQSVQQVVAEFCDVLDATTKARAAQQAANVEVTAKYPWRTPRYRHVSYTNQEAKIRGGILTLPHGKQGGKLRVTLPVEYPLPGRLMAVQLAYGVLRLVCEVLAKPVPAAPEALEVAGGDLGVNTLIAVTDGLAGLLVSGREAKAIIQWRNKCLAEIAAAIAHCTKCSKRWRRLQRAKYTMLDSCARKLRDLLHKTTRKVADAFPRHRIVVGEPFNDAARKMGRVQAQQVSSASNGRIVLQLAYKMFGGATQRPEPFSSQTCPVCGCRLRCRRVYQCKGCGLRLPRDVVGALNIRSLGIHEAIVLHQTIPTVIQFVRPLRKYPATPQGAAGSSGGTPARRAA
jgi:putative transposase